MSYRIAFRPSAAKEFSRLPKNVQRSLRPRIDGLAKNPFPSQVEKIAGAEALFRLRAGDYRIIYQVRKKVLLVLIVRIGHRKEVYRKLRQSPP